ncbi:DUF4437 domain-containing protein [Maribacter sp. 2308TA10-17]|uniref:DUF4437 domain-containing protein n=1 Tax=Maribacter sp. 2308TA10-17 TaxID=3386276 RepID=UPI0039BD6D5D
MKKFKYIMTIGMLVLGVVWSNAQNTPPDTSVQRLNTDGETAIFLTPEDLKWETAFDGFPINFAKVSGSTFKTPHSTFSKFPGGNFITPPHIHAHSYQAVVLSGKMINPMEGEKPEDAKVMGPGSYWYVPANQIHTTGCVSKEPCVFYMHQPVPFNFEPRTSEVKKNK